jgi:hypothetical protein
MNKPSLPTEARLLDAQAMQTLKQVAAEFTVFKSAASGKVDSKSNLAAMLTSVVADAVDRPHADVTPADKPQQRADLSRRILFGYRRPRFRQGAPICSRPGGRRLAQW